MKPAGPVAHVALAGASFIAAWARLRGYEGEAARIRGWKVTRIRGCEAARLRGYEAARLRGCEDTRLRGCEAVRLNIGIRSDGLGRVSGWRSHHFETGKILAVDQAHGLASPIDHDEIINRVRLK